MAKKWRMQACIFYLVILAIEVIWKRAAPQATADGQKLPGAPVALIVVQKVSAVAQFMRCVPAHDIQQNAAR